MADGEDALPESSRHNRLASLCSGALVLLLALTSLPITVAAVEVPRPTNTTLAPALPEAAAVVGHTGERSPAPVLLETEADAAPEKAEAGGDGTTAPNGPPTSGEGVGDSLEDGNATSRAAAENEPPSAVKEKDEEVEEGAGNETQAVLSGKPYWALNFTDKEVLDRVGSINTVSVVSSYLSRGRPNMAAVVTFAHWIQSVAGHRIRVGYNKCKEGVHACLRKDAVKFAELYLIVGLAPRGRSQHAEIPSVGNMRRRLVQIQESFHRDPQAQNVSDERALQYRAMGQKPMAVVITGDEWCEWTDKSIGTPGCVFKIFYHPAVLRRYPNVHWLPLGFSHKFPQPNAEQVLNRPAPQRRYLANLMCSLATSSFRRTLLNALTAAQDRLGRGRVFIHTAAKWNDKYDKSGNYVPGAAYRDVLLDSLFTLAPPGHNAESFRFWEALECGSIPIVFSARQPKCGEAHKMYLVPAGGFDCPVVIVPGHQEAVAFLLAAKRNLTHWYATQRQLLAWFTAYKAMAYGQALRHVMPRNPVNSPVEAQHGSGRKGRKTHRKPVG
eukprot:GGOE01037056.1.p1 GENE.GGOE01037056.1~~GGOE01037056.1.p1  ORF type:complete len:567 (+),score=114.69 GGOE01037056.1:42-1703(+)